MYPLGPHGNSSINIEGVSCDVIASRVKSKESNHTGDFLGLSKALEWDRGSDSLLQVSKKEMQLC